MPRVVILSYGRRTEGVSAPVGGGTDEVPLLGRGFP